MKAESLFPTDQVTRPPLRYHGGKFRLAPWIIERLPEHLTYVEVFGGGAGVLLRKPRSRTEIYNDLEDQVVNLFRVLRDPSTASLLRDQVALTPFAREEFRASYEPTADPIEAARRFVTRCGMGHGTCSMDPRDSNGFRSRDNLAGKSYAREWAGVPDAIAAAGARLQGVTIEHLDFRRVLAKYDSPETLFYVDPPYPMSTRDAGGKGYVHEMTDQDHRDLGWMLHRLRGKVAISGYQCALYAEIYSDWRREEKATTANGQRGAVSRTEVLWMNYPLQPSPCSA